ncbi:tetratricopeptide repeat protein [filamentous cyanobacterium LEGE 11480]|uniref:Tetratricopeptide repeat protein n=1 Tax=Romeriopsis navalis LEGE 11480 TaxID=2777977 RepID=A0A928VMQ9_9CYAN|nr:tetratricopeptide repeat protein [Romeriopsis navalis LEGE 11480]
MKLSLCMIVKDEAENLPKCLESVRNVVDEIIVLDTGSSDDTIAVAELFGAHVHQMPWPHDFSIARNQALQHTTGDWVLVLDADEVLQPEIIPSLQGAIQHEQILVINLIRHEVGAAQSPYSLVSRLFRRHPAIQFSRPYHAMIDDSVEALVKAEPHWQIAQLEGIAIAHTGYQADVIQQQDKFTKARSMMESFLAQHPDDPYVCSKLGALYIQMGDRDTGIQLLQRGLNVKNNDPATTYELNYHLGSVYAAAQENNQAAHYYQQAIRQPIDAKLKLGAMHNLASLMQNSGELVMAEGLYQQVLQIDPTLVVGHYNLGMTLKHMSRFTEAITHYQQAIQLQPDYAAAHQNLGVVLIKVGKVPEAIAAFQQAIHCYEQQQQLETAEQLRQNLAAMGFQLT